MTTTTRAIAYLRTSTDEQATNGHSFAAQRAAILPDVERRGWQLVEVVEEQSSGKSLDRPELLRVVRRLADGEADALVVAKLDRLSRSTVDAGELFEWFERVGAALVILDLGIDTTTPGGRLVGSTVAAVAQWEREAIGQRTKEALAARRTSGRAVSRPAIPADVRERIVAMRASGMSQRAIADALTAEGVPTARGAATWRQSAVQGAPGPARRPARRKRVELPDARRPRLGVS